MMLIPNSNYLQSSLISSSMLVKPVYIVSTPPYSSINYMLFRHSVSFPTFFNLQNENTNIEMQYNILKEAIRNFKITDHEYNDNLAQNIQTAELMVDALCKNKINIPEACVADDGEIEFDWINEDKEAIIIISRKNRYSYLLKQPSGQYLSGAETINEEKILDNNFVVYLSAEKSCL